MLPPSRIVFTVPALSRMATVPLQRSTIQRFNDATFQQPAVNSPSPLLAFTPHRMSTEHRKNNHKGPRILMVDDDGGQRSLLDSFLRGQGFDTCVVDSGEKARETLRAQPVSMMISDVRMPGMTGLETLRRARQEHAVLPVLLVTAYADIRDAVGAMRDGAVNYLTKPIDLDELLASVRKAVGMEAAISPSVFRD